MVSACPHCGKRLKAKDGLVGKQAVCPACKKRFTLAEAETAANARHRTAGPSSGQGPGAAPKSDATAEERLDSAPPPPAKRSKGPVRKKLLVAAMLTLCLIGAIIVAGAVYLNPEAEGPLTVYVVPHVDDIDGGMNPDWFFFFARLTQWHDSHSIPACFALFPETMGDEEFNKIIADMHASENIELVLKGEDEYKGKPLDQMSSEEARQAMEDWKGTFVSQLNGAGRPDARPPVTYNQMMMKLTEATRDAAREAQFKVWLELGDSEHGYIDMVPDFDMTQYSVSLTRSGQAGPAEEFKTPEEVIQELLAFEHDRLIYINGIKVVPLLCSQRDFTQSEESLALDETKWNTYTSLLRRCEKDSRIRLLTAREVYDLRHGDAAQ